MSGKRGIAPCGHQGEHIIGQYISCDNGCDQHEFDIVLVEDDAVPEFIDPEKTTPLCRLCGSADVEMWVGFMMNNSTLYFCNCCNRTFS